MMDADGKSSSNGYYDGSISLMKGKSIFSGSAGLRVESADKDRTTLE